MTNLRRQLTDALQRNRDLANEVFGLKNDVANLRLISPQGDRLSSLMPSDTKAWHELESAIYRYVVACGGKPQKPRREAARGAKKTR